MQPSTLCHCEQGLTIIVFRSLLLVFNSLATGAGALTVRPGTWTARVSNLSIDDDKTENREVLSGVSASTLKWTRKTCHANKRGRIQAIFSQHALTVIPPIGPRQLLPLPAATHVLAGGQHTPLPQSTGTRIPQLCLPPNSNPSARINNSCHRRSVSIFVQMTGSVSTWGRIHRAMEMNVLEGSDDSNTFILASSQRKCARICWQTIGGSSHYQGFETGRIWGCAATIMHRRALSGFGF